MTSREVAHWVRVLALVSGNCDPSVWGLWFEPIFFGKENRPFIKFRAQKFAEYEQSQRWYHGFEM